MPPQLLQITVARLPHAQGLPLPSRGSSQAAGWDLRAALSEPISIESCEHRSIPTGLQIAIPSGWEGQVRPRSGLAARSAITLTNAPGTIDSDYRGEIKILMINHGQEPVTIYHGERIAQLLFAPVPEVEWIEVESLIATERGEGGFGSTGID